ncbi:MAG: GH3 auxin-responsive promoter family protein [Gammaproteobacteria bacterium]
MTLIKIFMWDPLLRLTHKPGIAQNELLLGILKKNAGTVYGKQHEFVSINSYDDFCNKVPVNNYEALRSYIEKQELEKKPYLNMQQPVMYMQTSGTISKPKLIPVLKQSISQYKKSQHIVAYANYRKIPGVYKGRILAIVSPAKEGELETGTSYGSMSGLVYQSMPFFIRKNYVLPSEIFEIKDYEKKYYLITKYALAEKYISMIATANPTTIVRIRKVIDEQAAALIEDIRSDNPVRALELETLLNKNGLVDFCTIWPQLKSITTWTDGSCSSLIPLIKTYFNENIHIVEMGYLSSEFRGGITIDVTTNAQIPALHENFFEFSEKHEYESGNMKLLTIEQIKMGEQYYIFATTQNGLYRYDINDIVEVTGYLNKTPLIKFVQKGSGVTNLTGEKLYEYQVLKAVEKNIIVHNASLDFFVMIGCVNDLRYTLYIEGQPLDTSAIESELDKLNMEYESKRKSGRLNPLQIRFLHTGTGEKYKQSILKEGKREAQFKYKHLQYKHDCKFDFDACVRRD